MVIFSYSYKSNYHRLHCSSYEIHMKHEPVSTGFCFHSWMVPRQFSSWKCPIERTMRSLRNWETSVISWSTKLLESVLLLQLYWIRLDLFIKRLFIFWNLISTALNLNFDLRFLPTIHRNDVAAKSCCGEYIPLY